MAAAAAAAPPPPPPGTPPPCVPPYCTPGQRYNYQGCLTPAALAQPYCNTSLSIAARVASLVASLNITEKANRMSVNSEGPADDDTYRRLGLPPCESSRSLCVFSPSKRRRCTDAWLMETNTAANAACLNGTRCATNFVGPEGLAASFNRSVWRAKGEVVSTEQRAFSNHGAVKKPHNCQASKKGKSNPCYVSNTGYGPNINVLRSPQFGRNSEMVGEDPLLSGTYAKEMVAEQQKADAHGHPRMLVYLKHYTAYTLDCRVGGPPPKRTPTSHCNTDNNAISPYDYADTYLPQYRIAMTVASGVMCAYSAENGHPSCANDFLLNTVRNPQPCLALPCGRVVLTRILLTGAARTVASTRCPRDHGLRRDQPPHLGARLRTLLLCSSGVGPR